ncbi:hypothetical protein CMUS01_08998 [Colletotrichum musicola]|uniref:DUF6536 domain-containing protein n=1 Tax=Colletotrichum musicola TaxID=2175873 RepID=A0A8H6NCD5_9PEZI|nr:hypothetical protein CMUS01_08998 [Colletotrichum musicola]
MTLLAKIKGLLPRARWRRSVLAFAAAAFLAFLLNLSFILWATANTTIRDGIGTISDRSCASIKAWNTSIHAVINLISTTLFSGSNYCMQCLMAPTRSDIDTAHAEKRWLDVGVPSVRNLRRMPMRRKLLWLLLSVSSFPLHLLFNSVIFSLTSTNSYLVYPVNMGFLENTNATSYVLKNNKATSDGDEQYSLTPELEVMHAAFRNGELESLTVADCIKAYETPFQSSRGNLLLVWPTPNLTVHLGSGGKFYTSDEVLPGTLHDWKVDNKTMQGCQSQRTDEHCKLLFSSLLCWIITFVNLLKGCLMLLVAFASGERPLLTVGDAVASFLEDADEHTRGMSLKSKEVFGIKNWNTAPREFEDRPSRKLAWASLSTGAVCVLLLGLAIYGCIGLLQYGSTSLQGVSIWELGLGALRGSTILETSFMGQGTSNLLPNVVLANTPQVIASVTYYLYNSLFTSISISTEWDRFSSEPKGLRVSSRPRQDQKETYFLQLPYRYSLPLAAFSACVHWLISQSLFLVSLELWTTTTSPKLSTVANGEGLISCGWSPIGVLCVSAAIILLFTFLLVVGIRRLRFGVMPVAGSCSAAISAACHPGVADNTDEADVWTKPVRWGVVSAADAVPGHCSFSSRPVKDPVVGRMYA